MSLSHQALLPSLTSRLSPASHSRIGSPLSSSTSVFVGVEAMDLFGRAKAVRLRSNHGKLLTAAEDEENVTQTRDGSAAGARWEVEFAADTLRLRSCYGCYLAATGEHFLLGMTGKKVKQVRHRAGTPLDPSLEWEPVREGFQVKLKSRSSDRFLRANTSIPPWRNSITHDVPQRAATQDWVLWDVEIVQIQINPPAAVKGVSPSPSSLHSKIPSPKPTENSPPLPEEDDSLGSGRSSPLSRFSSLSDSPNSTPSPHNNTISSPALSNPQKFPSFDSPSQGRTIYYTVADDRGNVDHNAEWPSLNYSGTSVPVLARKLKQLTGIDDIIVCIRHPLKHTLTPIYLQLPPNNRALWIVVVDAESSYGQRVDI